MASLPPTPTSPDSRARRKPKRTPTLALSAFTPEVSGPSDSFPFSPASSSVNPSSIIDANVVVSSADLSQWKSEAGPLLNERIKGVVLSLKQDNVNDAIERIEPVVSGIPLLSLSVPFRLDSNGLVVIPPSAEIPVSLSLIYRKPSQELSDALKSALAQGWVVDVDVQFNNDDVSYESLEETLTKATQDSKANSAIILSNILPPADDLTLPLFKLLTDHNYRAYQAHTASLSLIPNTFIKFIPPSWHARTPSTPAPGAAPKQEDSDEKKEWKRRIKMYVSPALEAFGYQRIIFGSSPSESSYQQSSVRDWYELARESFIELGLEQEGIDAIFYENAKSLYESSR